MRIEAKYLRDYAPPRPRYFPGPIHSMRLGSLGVVPPESPYPNGISVAGTGPNNTALILPVVWYTAGNCWVVKHPSVLAPIFRESDFLSIVNQHCATAAGNAGGGMCLPNAPNGPGSVIGPLSASEFFSPRSPTPGVSPASGFNLPGASGPNVLAFTAAITGAGGWIGPGSYLGVSTANGGSMRVDYGLDAKTGYWIPVHMQGWAPDRTGWLETLVEVVALGGAAILSAGILTGALAPTAGATALSTIAPTAGAIGSSGASAAAAGFGTVAPEIASFTVPDIAPQTLIAESVPAATAPVDVSTVLQTAAAGVGGAGGGAGLVQQAMNVAGYVQKVASAYSTVQTLQQMTGGAATHPQAGTVIQHPGGATSHINADGSTTVTDANGAQYTITAGGQIMQGSPSTGGGLLALLMAGAAFAVGP